MTGMPLPSRIVVIVVLAALGTTCSKSPTAPTAAPALLVSEGVLSADTAPDPPPNTSIRISLGSCRGSTSTTWTGCDGTATVNVQKPVESGFVAVTLTYGCGTSYNCPSFWHGELRVSSTTPGSIVIPLTSTPLSRSLCTSPMTTVAHVFDARDGSGNPGNELYFQSFALTLNCGTTVQTGATATNSAFNGTWSGTYTGDESGFIHFSVSNGRITMDDPDDGTGALSLSTLYGTSSFFTYAETRSCTWTGPFIPGGARQSSASGLWRCSDGANGEWDAIRTAAAATPSPTPTTPTTPTTPSTGSGSITVISTSTIGCNEAGAGFNCRTGTIVIQNNSSSLAGTSVRLRTQPSHILAPVFRMPAVGGTVSSTVSGSPSTFSCPPTQTSIEVMLADNSPSAGNVLASRSVSIPVRCQ